MLAQSQREFWRVYRKNPVAIFGLSVIIVFVLIAAFTPWIAPQNPYDVLWAVEHNPKNAPPSILTSGSFLPYIFGTDSSNRDIFSQIIYGTWVTLFVGFFTVFISMGLGTLVGLTAGYSGEYVDEILMRITDFFLVIPWLPFIIVLTTLFAELFPSVPRLWIVIIVLAVEGWPITARLVRSLVLTVKERQFIERAKAIGSSSRHIILKHILPNVVPLVIANSILAISLAIYSQSELDFFGLGDPSIISWGSMIKEAYDKGAFTSGLYWWIIPPGLCIVLMVLAFSFVGHSLDEVLNPRLRERR